MENPPNHEDTFCVECFVYFEDLEEGCESCIEQKV